MNAGLWWTPLEEDNFLCAYADKWCLLVSDVLWWMLVIFPWVSTFTIGGSISTIR